jgi:hypothetical protein
VATSWTLAAPLDEVATWRRHPRNQPRVAVFRHDDVTPYPSLMGHRDDNPEMGALLAGIPQSGNALGSRAAPVTPEYFGDLEW